MTWAPFLRLSELAEGGGLFSDGDWVESKDQDPIGSVRLTQLADVGVGEFRDRSDRWLRTDQAAALRCTFLSPGDVLIARMPDPIGRACLAPPTIGMAVTAVDVSILRIRRTDVDARYVMWAINSPRFHAEVEARQSGTTRKRISRKNLAALTVPIPPMEEQRRIVNLLEDYLSRLDAAEQSIRRSLSRLAALRDATLSDAVETAYASFGVGVRAIGELAKVSSGLTPLKGNKAFYEGGTIPWITSGDLHQGLITEAKHFVTQAALDETTLKLVPAGAILIAMYGEGKTRGTAAELRIDATTNQACAVVVLHEPDLRPWVRLVLDANYSKLRRLAAGGVQPNLNQAMVKAIKIPIPPPELRRELLSRRVELDDVQRRLQSQLDAARLRSARLRRSLLAAAFSGRLTESASDLSVATELIPT